MFSPRLVAWVSVFVLGLAWGLPVRSEKAEDNAPPVFTVTFGETGQRAASKEINLIDNSIAAQKPTDIFVIAHGWLNDTKSANESYREHRSNMQAISTQYGLLANGFHPLLIGIVWPSLSPDAEAFVRTVASKEIQSLARETILRRLLVQGGPQSEANRFAHLFELDKLLAADAAREETPATANDREARKRDIKLAVKLFRHYLQKSHPDDNDANDIDPEEWAAATNSVKDALQVFTYWQMKKRAGVIGSEGVQPLLRELQSKCPEARIHLIGHSFGCKVAVSALRDDLKPIDTLVLLQGAISTQALAEHVTGLKDKRAGRHRSIFVDKRVKGPIVATFSRHDDKVGLAYPVASKLAKHVGEYKVLKPDFGGEDAPDYHGIGAKGFEGVTEVRARSLEPGTGYGFEEGKVYSIDASMHIPGHSDVKSPQVAWLMWNAVLRTKASP